MDKNIPIQVQKRMAWTGWPGYIVCGNEGYTITFDFDDEWDEAAAKTARFKFRTEEGMKHTDQPFVGNTVKVPVLSNIREVEVGVFVGDLTTTTGATIRCVPSIRCDSGEATEYEKERFDELMQLFNELLHGHDNKEVLDLLGLGRHGNLTIKTATGSESILWNVHNGMVVEDITPDETGDLIISLRLVPNMAVPSVLAKIKQKYKMSEIEDDVGYVKANPNGGGLVVNGEKVDLGLDGLEDVPEQVEKLDKASHTHDNQAVLDKFTSVELGAYDNPQFDGVFLWSVLHGYLLTDPEVDEETGDITLKYKTLPLDNIPASTLKIKQSYPEIWAAIEELRGGVDEIEAMIDESGVLE